MQLDVEAKASDEVRNGALANELDSGLVVVTGCRLCQLREITARADVLFVVIDVGVIVAGILVGVSLPEG